MNLKQMLYLNRIIILLLLNIFLLGCSFPSDENFAFNSPELGGKFIFKFNKKDFVANLDTVGDHTAERNVQYSLEKEGSNIRIIFSYNRRYKTDCMDFDKTYISNQVDRIKTYNKKCITPRVTKSRINGKDFHFIQCIDNAIALTCINNYLVFIHFYGTSLEGKNLDDVFDYKDLD